VGFPRSRRAQRMRPLCLFLPLFFPTFQEFLAILLQVKPYLLPHSLFLRRRFFLKFVEAGARKVTSSVSQVVNLFRRGLYLLPFSLAQRNDISLQISLSSPFFGSRAFFPPHVPLFRARFYLNLIPSEPLLPPSCPVRRHLFFHPGLP